MSDYVSFGGTFHRGEWEEPDDWVGGAPTSAVDQSCAICGADDVQWVHPLDPSKVTYRVCGKGRTLPTFWALCDRCEQRYQDGDDDALVTAMIESDPDHVDGVHEDVRRPLAVFRNADRGARRFEDSNNPGAPR